MDQASRDELISNIEGKVFFPETDGFEKERYVSFKSDFSNLSLGQEKHFKHVFRVGVGWEFEKTWINIINIRASADIYWFL